MRKYSSMIRLSLLALAPLLFSLTLAQTPEGLLFHASFDKGTDAHLAKGDSQLYSSPSYKQQDKATPGLAAAPNVKLDPVAGRRGSGALRFTGKNENAVFFRAAKNVNFQAGTISFWLSLNPDKDLAPDYCDPFQLTDKAYNDSAIWVDFTKDEKPRHFRLGVFGILKSWQALNLGPNKDAAFENRLVIVQKPPFAAEQWTHIAITHQALGTPEGKAALYLNGSLIGNSRSLSEPFAWDPQQTTLRLGINYIGLFDDLMVFNRALSASEIQALSR
jgi:hypothetical protein